MRDTHRKPPRIWIATLLGTFYPGAGQTYANDYRAAWLFGGISAFLAVVWTLLRQLPPTPLFVAMFLVAGIATVGNALVSGIQSFIASRRARRAAIPKGNRLVATAIAVSSALVFGTIDLHHHITGRGWHLYSHPSGSMEPTIRVGDMTVAAEGHLSLQQLRRGDIIITLDSDGVPWVRRLIGLPGDTVAMRDGRLYLDHQLVPTRPAATTLNRAPVLVETLQGRSYEILDQVDDGPGDLYPETLVPDGHVFLLGDNRDNAYDSRFVGPVPMGRIIGVVRSSYWSPGRGIWPRSLEYKAALQR